MLVSDGADVDFGFDFGFGDQQLLFSNSAVKDIMGQKRNKIDLRYYVRRDVDRLLMHSMDTTSADCLWSPASRAD